MKLFSWLKDYPDPTDNDQAPISPALQSRLAELERMSVREAMVPRSVVMALDVDVQLRRVRRLKSSRTSYFPVYKGDLDHVLGWIAKSRVLELLNVPGDEVQLSRYLRPVGEISEDATVADLSDAFLRSASPFLVVKNGSGGTVGLVHLSEFVELVFGFEMDTTNHAAQGEFAATSTAQYDL